jgi:8-oxo-dGTP pyrophosphatase MutT (NUDIX family)
MNVPVLNDEKLYIPFVGAIIERASETGKKEILVQIRKKSSDKKYSGCFEIPGGKLRAFEDIYVTLRREVKEECGLDLTFIKNEDHRLDNKNKEDTSTIIEPFCVTQMIEGPFIGFIFLCKASGTPSQFTGESENAKWVDIEELKYIIENSQEKFYTAFLSPLKKYLESVQS